MLHRLALLSLLTLSACGSSVVVAEKHHEAQAQDPDDAGTRVSAPCGNTVCKARSVSISGTSTDVFPCCYNEAESHCGIAAIAACIPMNDVGRIDTDCLPWPGSPIGTLPGCCRPDNTCGLYDTQLGFGCAQVPWPLFATVPGIAAVPGFATCKYNP